MPGVSKPGRRLGMIGYADILRDIRNRPRSAVEIAKRLDWDERSLRRVLRLWQRFEIIHCVRWEAAASGLSRAEVWRLGPGENAPQPDDLKRQLLNPYAMRGHAHAFSVIVRELFSGATVDDVTEASGVTRRIVASLALEMHRIGLLYIQEWHRRSCGGEPVPVYRMGSRADAIRPDPIGNAAAARKWRQGKRFRKIGGVLSAMAIAS